MNIRNQLLKVWNNKETGSYRDIAYYFSDADAWAFPRLEGAMAAGFAVGERNPPIAPVRFHGIEMIHQLIRVETASEPDWFLVIKLDSKLSVLRDTFALLASEFISREQREALVADPEKWLKTWKLLLGNAYHEPTVYPVLGELVIYQAVEKQIKQAEWLGPFGGTCDIRWSGFGIEVKSTVSRYDSTITVHGEFQLKLEEGEEVFVAHVRFEPSPTDGLSIDTLVSGFSEDKHAYLEDRLDAAGLPAGSYDRKRAFRLLDVSILPVDADFPRIEPQSFRNGKLPDGVNQVSYQVDLSNLKTIDYDTFISSLRK